MRLLPVVFVLLIAACCSAAEPLREVLDKSQRIVFLGDSITAAGEYVGYFDAWLAVQRRKIRRRSSTAACPAKQSVA
jgi:hypothetical protein